MSAADRAGRAWQRMLSGRRLDLIHPSPLDIEIEDIAHGLARVARWNGQTHGEHIFSVAQHSVLVELIARRQAAARGMDLDRRWRLATLLHDAPEYVVGDMISPFKAVIGGDYKTVEARLLAAVSLRFGLPAHWPASLVQRVKAADRASAFLEATRLAGFGIAEARRFFGTPFPLDAATERDYLAPWSAEEAKTRFLARFRELDAEPAAPAGERDDDALAEPPGETR
ncbi:YfbR-like 5'-deoxynucleotidase [Ancylobacter sp. TS-1]|uniref:YfbR-like 5'-deoxynucleotidase n=1 Tax=Ancylobacter sp. TS-1 TaxID=1850374 RepID=UPI001265BCCF|nr:HD family hydrolase [Ancylobacter sp. TS-1]QFR34059.1 HD domain-containing protein [Ancylobacter sp. TS-1]